MKVHFVESHVAITSAALPASQLGQSIKKKNQTGLE